MNSRFVKSIFGVSLSLSLLFCSGAKAQLRNDMFNTMPDSNTATFRTDTKNFSQTEDAQREGRHFSSFIFSGGLHLTSSSLTSSIFSTEAFVPERVNQTPIAITYSSSSENTCWTIISSVQTSISAWTRSGTTGYYFQCASSQPSLPTNSAWLMKVTISGSAITKVEDYRVPVSFVMGGVYSPTDHLYGAVGDGLVDDTTAIQAAIDGLPSPAGGTIKLACGKNFKVSLPLYWDNKVVNLEGCGRSTAQPGQGTRITATAGTNPIHVKNGSAALASSSRIANLSIVGSDSAPGTNDGLWIQANSMILQNIEARSFGGYGFHLDDKTGGPSTSTNTNHGRWDNLLAYSNFKGGYYIESGGEGNANTFTMINAISNTGFGIYDNSFLGNFYFGVHLAGNTVGGVHLGNITRSNHIYGLYQEGGNTPAVQIDLGGGGNNVVECTTCLRPDNLYPFVDNSTSGQNFLLFEAGGLHWTKLRTDGLTLTTQDFTSNWTETVDSSKNLNITSTFGGTVLMPALKVNIPVTQTLAGGDTITANACTSFKRINSTSAITTNLVDTFTAPDTTNTGCIMHVCNTGSFTITLDKNSHFFASGGANVTLTSLSCVIVGSSGAQWYQLAPVSTF